MRRIVVGVIVGQNLTRSNAPMKNETTILPFRFFDMTKMALSENI